MRLLVELFSKGLLRLGDFSRDRAAVQMLHAPVYVRQWNWPGPGSVQPVKSTHTSVDDPIANEILAAQEKHYFPFRLRSSRVANNQNLQVVQELLTKATKANVEARTDQVSGIASRLDFVRLLRHTDPTTIVCELLCRTDPVVTIPGEERRVCVSSRRRRRQATDP